MLIHLVENIVENEDRRVKQDRAYSPFDDRRYTPHNYNGQLKILNVKVKAKGLYRPVNITKNDLVIKPEEWMETADSVGYVLRSESWKSCRSEGLNWQPASTMPLDLARDCTFQWEVVEVLEVESKQVRSHIAYWYFTILAKVVTN